ncbi:MAG: GNVR domain-containing protein [Hoeflea sp.]|uniref:GNVR domain-containing protein n=1 Tax=Hoeflea sp. TaxID=1940281 RepID=UPI0032ED9C44
MSDTDGGSQSAGADATAEAPREERLDNHLAVPPRGPSGERPLEQARWAGADERPLLDMSILIQAVWRWRMLIGFATIAGAIIGVMIALSTPHRFYAESRLFVDPREVRVTEDDVRNQQLSTEAILAIIDSQLQILESTSVLETVVADLGLAQDPEFNGAMSSGGIGAGINLIKEIFTGRDPMSDAEQQALETLRDAVSVSRDSMTFVIIVGVDSRDPEKSALIANTIVQTYLDEEGEAQSDLLERTSDAIDTRINALREDLDEAERAVERFKAENGIVGVAGGQSIDDQEILAISEQLANARAVKVGVRVKAESLARANPEDVLAGSFPEEFLSANLIDLRKQYTQTKSSADALATRLGPRHPQYVSASQSLDTIREEITRELRRIVASSQGELQRAVETEQELASQMAVAKSRAMDQSVEFVTLRELERKATATKEIYEAFLRRSRETSERSNLSTRNVRVISPAEAPLQPMGPSRKFIAIGGMMTGFFMGFGFALLVGALESVRAFSAAGNGHGWSGRNPVSPSGGYPPPQPPHPGRGARSGDGYPVFSADGGAPAGERQPHAAGHATASANDEDPVDRRPFDRDFGRASDPVANHAASAAGFGNPGPAGSAADPAIPAHAASRHPGADAYRGSEPRAYPHPARPDHDHRPGYPGHQAPFHPAPMQERSHQPFAHQPGYTAHPQQAAPLPGYAPQGHPQPAAAPAQSSHESQSACDPRQVYPPQPWQPGYSEHPAAHHPAAQHAPVQQHLSAAHQAWGAGPPSHAAHPHQMGHAAHPHQSGHAAHPHHSGPAQHPHYPQHQPFQPRPFGHAALHQHAAPHAEAAPGYPAHGYPVQPHPAQPHPAQAHSGHGAPEPRQTAGFAPQSVAAGTGQAPRDEAVDRIREKMEELRARIGDRSGLRRRA